MGLGNRAAFEEEDIKENEDWEKVYFSKFFWLDSYRNTKNKKHIYFLNNQAYIHQDTFNRFNHPLKHLIYDYMFLHKTIDVILKIPLIYILIQIIEKIL